MSSFRARGHSLPQSDACARAAKLELFGGFRLSLETERTHLPISAQRVVAFLALHKRPMQRLFVAGSLWTRSDEHHANASLRSVLWRLQRADTSIVETSATHLQLAPELDVDLQHATDLLHGALDGTVGRNLETVRRICALGDLLPDWYDDWVVVEQERFRQLRLQALERLSQGLTQDQRWAEAIECGLAAVAAEPLRESAHRVTIMAHLGQGNISEAIRQYRSYRMLLKRHIGAEPSTDLERLVHAAVRHPRTKFA
jgi:DNA-binding SARP family transcriptional activator